LNWQPVQVLSTMFWLTISSYTAGK
jgi:hypothetical protein